MNRLSLSLALPALLVLSGCTTARMSTPAELATAPRMVVEGRQGLQIGQRLRFGGYRTDEVRRGSVGGSERRSGDAVGAVFRQTYAFRFFRGEEPVAAVECLAGAEAGSRRLGERTEVSAVTRRTLDCTLSPDDDPQAFWRLSLDSDERAARAGTLTRGAESLHVVETRRLERATPLCCDPAGYVIADRRWSLAAVDVLNAGSVRLEPTLDSARRDLLAAAAAALLLRGSLGEESISTRP